GYYPFFVEYGFNSRVQQVVTQILEVDIPQFADMKASTSRKLKQLLMVISQLVPYKPNMDNLAKEIGVSKNTIPDYFAYLEKAGLIGQLRDETGGLRGLGKVEKVYLDNPSLMTVLASGNPEVGNLRETFFYNHMRVNNDVVSSKQSDFVIGNYTFEIGGKKKGRRQIEDIPNGIIVRDDIEMGHGIVSPLWQYGFNY
ncbi:MAG: ATP-binding protein, partial [Bacteroidales bacterium]|nr:ATP-binding protein [Bacteroidales bacterium]